MSAPAEIVRSALMAPETIDAWPVDALDLVDAGWRDAMRALIDLRSGGIVSPIALATELAMIGRHADAQAVSGLDLASPPLSLTAVRSAWKTIRAATGNGSNPRALNPNRAIVPVQPSSGYQLTDLGNAERFAARHSDDFRYVEGLGWLWWDGKRWTAEGARAHLQAAAADTVRSMLAEAARLEDVNERAALAKWALRSESAERLAALIRLAEMQKGITVSVRDLDQDPLLFNAQNCTIHLRTGEARPHSRADLITKIAAASYDPQAPAEQWCAFVSWMCCGRADLVSYVQRVAGYCATGLTREQKWFLPCGRGANGKTTFWETVEEIQGDYSVRAMPDVFLGKAGHPTELAAFAGARLVLAIEPEMGKTVRDGLIKAVTGEARMTARRIGGNPVTFPVTFKIVMAANHRPPTRDTSDGFWRRVALIPFDNHISDADKDPALKDRLRAEWPGILAWIVQGAISYFEQGLGTPSAVAEATQGYREEQDQLRRFIEDECTLAADAWFKTGALFQAFREWCDRNGELTLDRQSFVAQLERVDGVREARRGYGRGHQGIALLASVPPVTGDEK